ncbi:unnamed protein product, partial [Brenthis ino]
MPNIDYVHMSTVLANVPKYKLSNGKEMPAIALGTYLGFDENGMVKSQNKQLRDVIMKAIDIGYRHFDTASIYGTEEEIGEAVRLKIEQDVVKREDLFITTKLWNTLHKREQVVQSLRDTVHKMGLNYIDLYLMHWPMGLNEDYSYSQTDFMETWRGMEDAVLLGLVKCIGVSNFNKEQLIRLIKESNIKPVALQIEVHPQMIQTELVDYAQSEGIVVMGYSPFGSLAMRYGTLFPGPRVDNPILVEIAKKYRKTTHQIVLRWLVDRKVVPIPKTVKYSRLKENIDIFDFELTAEEIQKINKFDIHKRFTLPSFWQTHPYYPFEKALIKVNTVAKVTPFPSMTYSGRNKFEISRFSNEDENHINKKLPKELLLRILSYLDVVSLCRCAQVSKLWNILALDGSNWQRIDLFNFQRDVEGPVIENISQRCGGFLRQLSLRGCESIADGSIKTLAQSCPNIEDLNLNKCKKLTDQACQALGRKCGKLQKINLDSCPSISDISLKALSDGCPLLTHVNVSWCQSITENGVEALARGCPKLKSFICRGCKNVNDKAVSCLATYCPDLEVLNVQGCDNLTDESISKLGGAMRRLCVSGCARLTDAALAALAARCPDLVTLELSQCAHLTDAGFQALARSCRMLERMDLEECVLITDATLVHLAMGCPRLEKLTLSHCELITDYGIKQLSMSPCAAEHLTVLGLDNCPLVTDGALEHLISCHNLQRIELYDCQMVTRNAIRKLRNHLPNIRVHAYFAPVTPPVTGGGVRPRYCRCCNII